MMSISAADRSTLASKAVAFHQALPPFLFLVEVGLIAVPDKEVRGKGQKDTVPPLGTISSCLFSISNEEGETFSQSIRLHVSQIGQYCRGSCDTLRQIDWNLHYLAQLHS